MSGLAYAGLVVVGILLLSRISDALYWLVAIVLVLVLTAVFNAWDLLVQVGVDIESPAAPKG
jgi:hypothetical protein